MGTSPVSEDYEQTVGAMNRYRESTVATWRGDPKRAAQIILGVVDMEEPPLRLLLGAGAVEAAAKSAGARRGSRKVGGGQPVCRLPAGRIAPILPLPPYRRAGQRHPQLFVAGAQEYDVLSEGVKPGKSGSVAPTTPSTYGSRNADGRSETERRACGDVGS